MLFTGCEVRMRKTVPWMRACHVRLARRVSQQRERETIRYRPANNKKNHVRHHVKMRPLDMPKSARFVSYLSNCVF